MGQDRPTDGHVPRQVSSSVPGDAVDRVSWKSWTVFLFALSITTLGLVTAVPPLVDGDAKAVWPWPKAEHTLLVVCSLIILAFAAVLTYQRRRILTIHSRHRDYSRRHLSRLYALLNVGQIMGAETGLQEVFDCITKMCVETFDCEQASLMLLDKATDSLEVRSAYGHVDTALVIGRRRAIGEGVAGWVAQHRRPLLLGKEPDENCPPEVHLASPEISAAMVVPITLRNELVGVINVSARSAAARFDEEDLHALEVFASNAGTCIRHTEHAAWMRQVIRRYDSKPAHSTQR